MRKIIESKLRDIESREKVRILLAVESGSRAWGFASEDSDYDVRFVYVRQLEDYLSLNKSRDVIEWQLDSTLDINGWDIEKALKLLKKSNPNILEWLSSPIIYQWSDDADKLVHLGKKYLRLKSLFLHYISMAESNYNNYLLRDDINLKKYFYTLRPLLACQWLLERKTQPPVPFSDLCQACLPLKLRRDIEELIQIKTQSREKDTIAKIDHLHQYIEERLNDFKERSIALAAGSDQGWKALNDYFLSLLFKNE